MKFFCEMSEQLRSGGGGGIQKSGYDEWQFFGGDVVVVGLAVVVVVGFAVVVVVGFAVVVVVATVVVVVVTGEVVVVSANVVVVASVIVVVLDEVVVEDDVDDVPAKEVVVESAATSPLAKTLLPNNTKTTSPLGM